ncbi:MAG: Hpt domain-containing protein [Candidatus Omnitrophica bacterium]|nr:Hpt domain-containing protein [Candidatus Omnitrophota bacterium]
MNDETKNNYTNKNDYEQLVIKNSNQLQIPPQAYLKIAKLCLVEGKKDISALEEAIAKVDFPKIQTISHRMKGSFANMILDSISKPAMQINELSKKQEKIEEIKELFSLLTKNFSELPL